MEYFQYLTPVIYLLLVIVWSYIFYFYLRKIHLQDTKDKLLITLLIVLAIDAFRTLIESSFFGLWFTSLSGILPIHIYEFLAQPEIVFFPKIINLVVSLIILFILIRKWMPAETSQRAQIQAQVEKQTAQLQNIINNLNITKNDLTKQKYIFEIMFNTIPDGVVITNTKREIILANKGMETTFGYRPENIIGKTTELLYADKSKFDNTGAQVFDEPAKSTDNFYITYYKTKDNIVFPGETYGTKLYNNQGEWTGNLGIMRNISERVNFINEIKKAKGKAEESDRLKSAFLANMSHEIRTPMNGIMGFAQLLKEPNLKGEEQIQFIDIIENSGKRMLNIINDIIDLSKIEAGQMELILNEVNINKQTEYLYTFFKPEAEKNGLKLSFDNGLPNHLALIESDKEKIYAILTNLIKNAIKYTNSGNIDFGYQLKTKNGIAQLEYYVKDTGIGIESERQLAVFERFIQADQSLSSQYEGAGLGLAITKAYVEILGGEIWLESEPNIGSQFYFTIPYHVKATPKIKIKADSAKPDEDLNHKKLTVLIAEDDEISSSYLSTLTINFSKEILLASNGLEAIEIFKQNKNIDLIFMDIKMPVMDGYTATKKIREIDKEVCIIAQTAYALHGDREKALEIGCNDYISKPITKKQLLDLITKHTKKE